VPGMDAELARALQRALEKQGLTFRLSAAAKDLDMGAFDRILVSVGRRPFADLLNLESVGVATDPRGFVQVDELCRTTVDGIYALGDLVATPQLAHVGFAEAIVAVRDMLGEDLVPVDYGKVPWCIYCHPEVAFAGMTEQAARDAGHDVTVSKHSFNANSRAMIIGETEGLVKVIAAKGGPILGVHMVGPWVTEQLGEGWLSVNWEATPDDMGQLIHPHPTLSETFGETVLSLTGRGLHG